MKLTLLGKTLATKDYIVTLYEKSWWLKDPYTDGVSYDGVHSSYNPRGLECGLSVLRPTISWREER